MDKFDTIISNCYKPERVETNLTDSVMDRVTFSILWKRYKYLVYILLGISTVFAIEAASESNFIALIKLLFTDYDIIHSQPGIFWEAFGDSLPWASIIIIILFLTMTIMERRAIRRYLMLRNTWFKNPVKN